MEISNLNEASLRVVGYQPTTAARSRAFTNRGTNFIPLTTGSADPNCMSYGFAPPADTSSVTARFNAIGQIVYGNDTSFDDDSIQMRYYDYRAAYNFLDSSSINLGDASDSIYQAFSDSMRSTEVGTFALIDSFIQAGDLFNADSLRNTLRVADTLNMNEWIVDSIYIKALACDSLTADDSTTLLDIANQDPLFGGNGVLKARIILQYEPDEDTASLRLANHIINTEPKLLKIYPNPNGGSFTVSYPLNENQTGIIEIQDIAGRKLCVERMNSSVQTMSCDVLYQGVFIGRLKLDDGEVFNFKIVVVK